MGYAKNLFRHSKQTAPYMQDDVYQKSKFEIDYIYISVRRKMNVYVRFLSDAIPSN